MSNGVITPRTQTLIKNMAWYHMSEISATETRASSEYCGSDPLTNIVIDYKDTLPQTNKSWGKTTEIVLLYLCFMALYTHTLTEEQAHVHTHICVYAQTHIYRFRHVADIQRK